MKIILGLSGSGKTTLYRQLNEKRKYNAVELELPPSCNYDDDIKEKIFRAYYNSSNIQVIILHWKFLPNNFLTIINKNDELYYLDVEQKTRKTRLIERGLKDMVNNTSFFDKWYFKEERYFVKKWKDTFKKNNRRISKWM